MEDFFIDLQLWGTPEQVTEKIINLQDEMYADGYMGVFSYAGMSLEEAERSMHLFRLKGDARTAGSSRSARSAWRAGVRTADATSSTSTSR